MDEGMLPFPDFGDAICYYRYYRLPKEFEPPEPQEQNQQRKSKLTNDELRARLKILLAFVLSAHKCFLSQSWQASLSVAKGPVHMQKEEYNEFAYSTFLS